MLKIIYFTVVNTINTYMYGIIVWGSAYKNALEPFNVAHRIFVRIMLQHLFNENNHTDDLFLKYYKLVNFTISCNKNQFKPKYTLPTRNTNSLNLALIKPSTTLIQLFYVYRVIQLFNKLPIYMKAIDNN